MVFSPALKVRARRQAARLGLHVQGHVKAAAHAKFFDSIRPQKTNHDLVRIGGDGDGGYLVPDDLAGIKACFSPGVDYVASFEEGMIARNIRCFQVDASVEKSPLEGHPLVDFQRKFLGVVDDDLTLTLDRWVAEKMPSQGDDLILQMDIEGAEWLALINASEATLARFRIILIEFHDFENIFQHFAFDLISSVFDKLLRQFVIVHVHPNNCAPLVNGRNFAVPSVLEYSLIRRDRIVATSPAHDFPHPLDQENSSKCPKMELPSFFYAGAGEIADQFELES